MSDQNAGKLVNIYNLLLQHLFLIESKCQKIFRQIHRKGKHNVFKVTGNIDFQTENVGFLLWSVVNSLDFSPKINYERTWSDINYITLYISDTCLFIS